MAESSAQSRRIVVGAGYAGLVATFRIAGRLRGTGAQVTLSVANPAAEPRKVDPAGKVAARQSRIGSERTVTHQRDTAEGASQAAEPAPSPAALSFEAFEEYRPLLFSIAYRMLGSVTDAEDIVQEAYLRFQATPPESIRSLKAFLTTVVTRLCLDQLKSARAKRESYIGPWLPEPILTGGPAGASNTIDRVEMADDISLAFLILLETLTPIERAVFLLREVFDYGYPEIAEIVGRREDSCRQIFRRAKQHIGDRRPRFRSTRAERQRLTAGFLRAVQEGDLAELTRLLADDATFWSDGGGLAAAATRPVRGRENVGRMLIGLARQAAEAHFEVVEANGCPAVLVRAPAGIVGVAVLEVDGDRVRAIHTVVNPEKLRHLTVGSPADLHAAPPKGV